MSDNNQKEIKQEAEQEQTIEEMFTQAEDILKKLEGSELSLEESFAAYEQGMQTIKKCAKALDMVEKRMQILTQTGETEDFV